ncbi:M20 family metallopeptidase [Streptomyces sp. NPDC033754]|uniref:M20 family metallopeptidase n=1 Tax=unclassified Streptomyces TaxID=2593676 RepID=UPI0033E3F525
MTRHTARTVREAPAEARREAVRRWCGDHRTRIAEMVGALVRVPTTAPDEPAAHPLLTGYLLGAGLWAEIQKPHPRLAEHPDYTAPFLPGAPAPRDNMRAGLKAGDTLPTVLFSVHTDVVPPDGHPEPWSGRFDGTRVHGRGSADTKNNIVMVVEALRCLRELGLTPRANVLVDLVGDEEAGGTGALSTILHGCPVDEVVVLEPTGLRVHHGHRGCVGFEITASGTTGHMGSAADRQGPVERCLRAVDQLRAVEERWLDEAPTTPGFIGVDRPLRLNISGITADSWHGSTPSSCTLRASLGYLPPRDRDRARAEIAAAVLDPAGRGDGLALHWRGIGNDGYVGDAEGATARRLRDAARTAGVDPGSPQAWHVSCDARLYARHTSAETVVFGGGELALAHSDHESVDIDQVLAGVHVLVEFLAADGG